MLQGVCVEENGEAKCECPVPYSGVQCEDASEIADFMLDEINNNLAMIPAQESSDPEARWSPDCQLGECHVPDFSGQSYLEFQTLDNVAKFADIEVSFIKRPTRSCCSDFLNIYFSAQIWFLSRSSNGMLLYNGGQSSGSGDFIAINIINSYVQLSYDLGSGVVKITSLR